MAVAESEETGMHNRHKRSVTIESSISLSDSRGEQQLRKQIKGTMIGVVLDSPSDSWVPTHGATSVPSMPAFSGNPILPTRSRQDILENPKAPTFQHETRLEIVAPDQVQIWWRQSLRHKENIDINFAAEFATH